MGSLCPRLCEGSRLPRSRPPPAHRLQDRAGDRAAPSAWQAGEEAPSEGSTEAGRAPHRGLRARSLGRGWGIGLRRAEEGWPGRGQSGPQRDGCSCKPRGSHGAERGGLWSGAGPTEWPRVEARGTGLCMGWSLHRSPKEGETLDQEDPAAQGRGQAVSRLGQQLGWAQGPEEGIGVGHHSTPRGPVRTRAPRPAQRGQRQGEAPAAPVHSGPKTGRLAHRCPGL